MGINEACQAIKKYNNFLITVHTSPEGDALGSEIGFLGLIEKLGKKGVIVNEDKIPYGYDFICPKGLINILDKNSSRIVFDCFVALDCADLARTGEVYKLNSLKKPILNIDHHISNRNFGDINWVDPEASSCSEMVYRLYKKLGAKIEKFAALAIYTGIMTDTGSFHYSNTSSSTFKAASELLKTGINTAEVYRNTHENIPLSDMKVLLKLLPKIKFYFSGKVACFRITKQAVKDARFSIDIADQLLNFARMIKGVEVVLLLKENFNLKNQVRINLRSQGKVDVNKIASYFAGGGHKAASGATLTGSIDKIEKEVISKIRAFL